MRSASLFPLLSVALLACADGIAAQGTRLDDQVARAPDGPVQFHFASRSDACGNGETMLRVGSSVVMYNGGAGDVPCQAGPARVELVKADGEIIRVRAFVGPLPGNVPGTDLGRVGAREAAGWLLELAATAEGRPGRDAIFPATLADSTVLTDPLLDLARNRSLSRQVRTSATGAAAREVSRHPESGARIRETLLALARDAREPTWMRTQSLRTLGRLPDGSGVPALLDLHRGSDPLLGKEVVSALASTDDPRARDALRGLVRGADTREGELREAIRGLGRQYATGEDAALLRERYSSFPSKSAREAVIAVLGDVGGSENVQWLLARAARDDEVTTIRTRALRAAARAGGQPEEIARVGAEGNSQIRETIVTELLQIGSESAIETALSLVSGETDTRVQRRLVSRLSRSEHPKVRAFLQTLVER